MTFEAKTYYNRIIGFIIILVLIGMNLCYADDESTPLSDKTLPAHTYTSPRKTIEQKWNKINTTNNVTHYARPIEGTPLTAYKGVCVVNSTLKTIYSILTDVSNHSKWVRYCKSSKTLKSISKSYAIQYYDFDIPWPFDNRDIVIKSTLKADWENGKIVITGSALKEPVVPVKKTHLRITDSKQKWILEKISHDKTLVTFISSTSIKGSVPKMFNRLMSSIIPGSSLLNLKKVSTDTYYKTLPRYIAESKPKKNINTEMF